jgi:CrcB protein
VGRILLIGLGGFAGSVLRYLVSGYAQQVSRSAEFPYGTLVVNVLGCLVIGFLSELAEGRGVLTPEARAFLVVGFLGGFTTFSTFGNETINLLRDGESLRGLLNVAAHLLLGLAAVYGGRVATYLIWR